MCREVVRRIVVQARVNGAGSKAVQQRPRGKQQPGGGEPVTKAAESHQSAAGGQQGSDPHGIEQLSGEKTGQEVAAPGSEEYQRHGALRQQVAVAHRRPGYPDQRVRKAKTQKSKIGDNQ